MTATPHKDGFGPWGARGSKAHPGEGAGLRGRVLGGRNTAAGRGDSSRNPRGRTQWFIVGETTYASDPRKINGRGHSYSVWTNRAGLKFYAVVPPLGVYKAEPVPPNAFKVGEKTRAPAGLLEASMRDFRRITGRNPIMPWGQRTGKEHPGEGAGLATRKPVGPRPSTPANGRLLGHQVIVGRKLPKGTRLKNPSSGFNTVDEWVKRLRSSGWTRPTDFLVVNAVGRGEPGFTIAGSSTIHPKGMLRTIAWGGAEPIPTHKEALSLAKRVAKRLGIGVRSVRGEELLKPTKENPDASDIRLGTCPGCNEQVAVPRGVSSGRCGNCGGSFTVAS